MKVLRWISCKSTANISSQPLEHANNRLQTIVQKAMSIDPKDRYEGVEILQQDIHTLLRYLDVQKIIDGVHDEMQSFEEKMVQECPTRMLLYEHFVAVRFGFKQISREFLSESDFTRYEKLLRDCANGSWRAIVQKRQNCCSMSFAVPNRYQPAYPSPKRIHQNRARTASTNGYRAIRHHRYQNPCLCHSPHHIGLGCFSGMESRHRH